MATLAGQAVPRLQLVEAGGEALVGPGHRGVWLLLFAGSVLLFPVLASLLLTQRPLLFREASLHVGEGLRERELSLSDRSVRVRGGKRLHSVASDSSVASLAHSSAISLPSTPWWLGHHRVSISTPDSLARRAAVCFLASRAYSCPSPGHSPDGRLRVREDGDGSDHVAPGGRHLEDDGGTLGAVGFLAPAHAGLVAFPGEPLLRGDRVSRGSVLQAGSVREDGEPWPDRLPRLARRCGFFLDCGGASRGVATSARTMSSLPFQHPMEDWSRCPSSLSEAPIRSMAWSPFGRLASRRAKRRRRLFSCAAACLSPDSRG